jgi:hypothetical protein
MHLTITAAAAAAAAAVTHHVSIVLHAYQMLGRGTRPAEGALHSGLAGVQQRLDAIAASAKPFLTVIDVVDVCARHKVNMYL